MGGGAGPRGAAGNGTFWLYPAFLVGSWSSWLRRRRGKAGFAGGMGPAIGAWEPLPTTARPSGVIFDPPIAVSFPLTSEEWE